MSDAKAEAKNILDLCNGDRLRAFEMVQGQLAVLVLRTQVMLSLSTVPHKFVTTSPPGHPAQRRPFVGHGPRARSLLAPCWSGAAAPIWSRICGPRY